MKLKFQEAKINDLFYGKRSKAYFPIQTDVFVDYSKTGHCQMRDTWARDKSLLVTQDCLVKEQSARKQHT